MAAERTTAAVGELVARGILFVEDGNHGEYRPLPDEFDEVGTPFIRPDDLKDGRIDFASSDRINDQALARVRKGKGRAGDIAFTHRATVGRIARAGRDAPNFVANPGVTIWRCNTTDIIDPGFLYFYMQTPDFMNQVWAEAGNTDTFPYISLTQQRGLHLTWPRIEEQRAIAHILGTLDDKIALNRQMNATLEAMARALFNSWFVDFDPVHVKAEGRDPVLRKRIADLFPDSFEDSEFGEIPKGWRIAPLRELTNYLARGIGPAYVDNGGICVLNQKCIRDRRVNFRHARRHDSDKRSVEGRTLRSLDILVNSTGVGTLGRIAQLWELSETAIVDSHVTVIRPTSEVDPWFLGVLLIGRENEVEMLGEGSTGQTELSRERLGSLACVVPPPQVQVAFGHVAGKLLSRVAGNDRASVALATLRDTLLPKLISGELRVGNSERFYARAG